VISRQPDPTTKNPAAKKNFWDSNSESNYLTLPPTLVTQPTASSSLFFRFCSAADVLRRKGRPSFSFFGATGTDAMLFRRSVKPERICPPSKNTKNSSESNQKRFL
jgi:hypothetical protein